MQLSLLRTAFPATGDYCGRIVGSVAVNIVDTSRGHHDRTLAIGHVVRTHGHIMRIPRSLQRPHGGPSDG